MDIFTIHLHLERAAAGRHERQRFNILFQLEELLRQTDGMRLVVSGRAILNSDLQSHNAHNVGNRPPLVKVPALLRCYDAPRKLNRLERLGILSKRSFLQ